MATDMRVGEDPSTRTWSGAELALLSDAQPVTAGPPAGGTSVVERLLTTFEAHASEEEESMAAYRRLARESADPVVAFLMRVVIDDEVRHHRLLERMSSSLRDGLQWSHSTDALPSAGTTVPPASEEAIEVTKAFIREERDGAHFLRQVAHDEKYLGDGLFSLLLETMAMDSDKHERIMRFILHRLESSR